MAKMHRIIYNKQRNVEYEFFASGRFMNQGEN